MTLNPEPAQSPEVKITPPASEPDHLASPPLALDKELEEDDDNDELPSSSLGSKQGAPSQNSKRRRSDHNEIERRRREIQRDRIEELRQVLPGSTGTTRMSTLNIVIRAREYIESLRSRISELESILSHYNPNYIKSVQQPQQQNQAQTPLFRPITNVRPLAPKSEVFYSPLLGLNSNLKEANPNSRTTTTNTTDTAASGQPRKATLTPSEEEHLKRKILDYFRTQRLSSASLLSKAPTPSVANEDISKEKGLHAIAEAVEVSSSSESSTKRNSDSLSEAELKDKFQKRRNSSLLFSSGNGVFWNHRDSSLNSAILGNMFPIEETLHMDIRCGKCQRGIDNLIMIDCEKCKTWFHLRCVNVSPEAIPITWFCPEC